MSHPEPLVRIVTQLIAKNPSFDIVTDVTIKHSEIPGRRLDTYSTLHSLLGTAVARRSIYISAITGDINSLQKTLRCAAELNIDVGLAAIDCVPKLCGNGNPFVIMKGLAKAWLGLIKASRSSEVCSAAVYRLAETIDRYFENAKAAPQTDSLNHEEISALHVDIAGLSDSIRGQMDTPSLSNARIRVSGAIPLFKELSIFTASQSQTLDRTFLEPWGQLLAAAGAAHNVCQLAYPPIYNCANKERTLIRVMQPPQPWPQYMGILT